MIKVDISNIWGVLSLSDLLGIEAELSAAHMAVTDTGWMELPDRSPTAEHMRLLAAAHRIRENSDALVVVSADGAGLGARAVIELLQGVNRNLRCSKGDPMLLWAGADLSTRGWNELARLLEGRDFSLCVISRTGDDLESAVAFRNLRWMLERRFGTAQAKRRIYAVTHREEGLLRHMAEEEGWESFALPEDAPDCFGVLSPAGLLPMAAAGVDVMALLRGAAQMKAEGDLRSFENPVWLYAAVRELMRRRGRTAELMESFEPDFASMGRWWQRLSAGTGGGLYPAFGELTGQLPVLSRLLHEGDPGIFETMLRFGPPARRAVILEDVWDPDGLNYLAGRKLDELEEQLWQSAMADHSDSGCPVVAVECGPVNEQTMGALIWFFQLSCVLSAGVRGADPFDRSGIDGFRRELFARLGRPGLEA